MYILLEYIYICEYILVKYICVCIFYLNPFELLVSLASIWQCPYPRFWPLNRYFFREFFSLLCTKLMNFFFKVNEDEIFRILRVRY